MAIKIIVIGFVIFLAYFFAHLFRKTRVPDVLLLMLGGILAGPVFSWVVPEDFGAVGPVLTTIALIVILFDSGLSMKLKTLMEASGQALLISAAAWSLSAATVTAIMYVLTPLGWGMSFMTGAILGGTSSAVVIPLVEGLRMREKPRTVAVLESTITDVLCIVGAVAALQIVKGEGGGGFAEITTSVLASFGFAVLIGILAGLIWTFVMGWVRDVPNTIFSTVAYVFVIYGFTELVDCSGAIAALAFGITLANLAGVRIARKRLVFEFFGVSKTERLFFSEIVFLLKIFFFIYLGISLRHAGIVYAAIGLIIVFFVYAGRIGLIRLIASRRYTRRDAAILSTLGPKGLAAAVLATMPLQEGLPNALWVEGIVYMVVLISITLTSILVFVMERTPAGEAYFNWFGSFQPPEESEAAPIESAEGGELPPPEGS